MRSQHPIFFWTLFALFSALFLFGWFVYWETRKQGFTSLSSIAEKLPVAKEWKSGAGGVGALADTVMNTDGKERTYLILFQNDMELRPGGGFIGSFGILKVRDGSVSHFSVHDTGNFDGRIPDTIAPPYPMQETLGIKSWKLRDSNWEPDFPTNARKAIEFYEMGGGEEKFDGVIGITTNVLSSFLRVTGPVEVPGYPGTYDAETGVYDLEYQVEKGFDEQGIEFGERKSVLGLLGEQILGKVRTLSAPDLFRLFQVVLGDLNHKDIQFWFADEELEKQIVSSGWGGVFDVMWPDDFLMIVDANLNAWKTDRVMKRSYRYEVNLREKKPKAKLTITYEHTATVKDFMTKDYQTFLRVYVPNGSWFERLSGNSHPLVYGEFMGRKYVGALVQVPLGTTREVVVEYALPESIDREWYDLKMVRQPGTGNIPITIVITHPDGTTIEKQVTLDRDFVLSQAN